MVAENIESTSQGKGSWRSPSTVRRGWPEFSGTMEADTELKNFSVTRFLNKGATCLQDVIMHRMQLEEVSAGKGKKKKDKKSHADDHYGIYWLGEKAEEEAYLSVSDLHENARAFAYQILRKGHMKKGMRLSRIRPI